MSSKILENIQAGKFSRQELENLYANAERLRHPDISRAAKEALRHVDARSYAKRFVKPIRDKVREIAEDVARSQGWANWDDNKVENGVKAGGAMLKGEELAEFYISYRHPSWKRSSYLVVLQHDEHSSILYKVKAHNAEEQVVETSETAIDLFRSAIETS